MSKGIKQIILGVLLFAVSFAIGIILTEYGGSRAISTENIVYDEAIEHVPAESELIDEKVNINAASSKTLQTLSGIGEKMSERIIEYRTENGVFHSIENLMDVPGIGLEKFNSIKDKICTGL